MRITKKEARLYLLAYQYLLPDKQLVGKEGILTYINRVGSIQFDPLMVIDTNPHLVLQSRIKDYQRDDLPELLYKDRKLIDDWDKNQCIYQIDDWPYFKRFRNHGLDYYRNIDVNEEDIKRIKSQIKEKGPLSSLDFEDDKKIDWFFGETKISRLLLEKMYYNGEIAIHHKEGVRKYYDLVENVIPRDIYIREEPNKNDQDFYNWIIERRIGSIGLLWNKASDAYLGISNLSSKYRNEAFKQLADHKKIMELEIEDIEQPLYIRSKDLPVLNNILNGISYKPKVSFIAPLDNLLWDRKLIKELFNFEYTWEVYKPKAERIYGYYVMPILYDDEFIGRIEPVFDKKSRTLNIINLWFEKEVTITKELSKKIDEALKEFANYLHAEKINMKNQ